MNFHPSLAAVAAATLLSTSVSAHTAGLTTAPPDRVQTLELSGAKLQFIEQGSGPLVILVHGSLGNFEDWGPEVAALSDRYRVVAYSRRFHPPNAPPAAGERYFMEQQAEDLAALIRARGGPAQIVAHSYGAYTALYMALHHPELVRSLVLAEPPILGWLNASKEGRSAMRQFQRNALQPSRTAFQRGDDIDGLRRFIDGVSGAPVFDKMPAELQAQFAAVAPEMRAEMTTEPSVYMRPVTCSEVRNFARPVLVLTAERSARLFHIIADRLVACLAKPETGSVPDAAHGSMLNSSTFQSRVRQFLDAHRG